MRCNTAFALVLALLVLPISAIAANGAVVEDVVKKSSADRAGITIGDILVAWRTADGKESGAINSPFDAQLLDLRRPAMGEILVKVVRDGQQLELEMPDGSLGMTLRPAMDEADTDIFLNAIDSDNEAHEIAAKLAGIAVRQQSAGACYAAAWLWGDAASRLRLARDLEQADEFQRQALATDCVEGDALIRAWLLTRAGTDLWRLGQYDEAIAAHVAALELQRAAGARLAAAYSLMRLVTVSNNKGDFDASAAYGEQAKEIYDELAPVSMAQAQLLHSLGNREFWSDHLDEAYDYYAAAAEMRKAIEPGGLDHGRSTGVTANVAWRQDRLERAESLLSEALDVFRDLQPGGKLEAAAHTMLGHVTADRRDFRAAESHYFESLEILEKADPYAVGMANVVMGLGNLERRRRNFAGAKSYLERAREIYTRLDSKHRIALVNNNLANVAADMRDFDEAERLYLASLAYKRQHSPQGFLVATTLFNLGRLERDRGNFELAERYYLEGVEIFNLVAPEGLRLSQSLTTLGKLMLEWGGREQAAESYLQRGLALAERLSPGTLFEAEPLHAFGRLARERGQVDAALQYYSRALDAFEAQRKIVGGTDSSRSSFADHYAYFYKDYVELLIEAGMSETAYHTLERYRARVMLAMWADRTPAASELPAELEAERMRVNREYDSTLEALLDVDSSDTSTTEGIARQLQTLRGEREQLAAKIRAVSPRLSAIEYPEPLTLADTLPLLEPGVAVLSYCVTAESVYLFALRGRESESGKRGFGVLKLDLGAKELREAVEKFRVLVRAPGMNADFVASLWRHSHFLYEQLLAPAKDLFEGSDRIVFVADGALHFLPFAALATNPLSESGAPHYFVEHHAIRSSLSVTTLLASRQRALRAREDVSVAVFADPLPGENAPPLAPLAGASVEAKAIDELFPDRTQVYLRETATEGRAKSLRQDVTIAHFATHAVLDVRQPLDSFLVLAADKSPAPESNGLLQAWEVMEQMHISADLVALSGCETHLGAEASGEGLIGLTRAFQYAGAQSVLASLWAVSDTATAELMRLFYDRLRAGDSHDTALRAAQLTMIRGDTGDSAWDTLRRGLGLLAPPPSGRDHPFYWAGFNLH